MPDAHGPWWRGTRGEWWVVGQVALILAVFVGPRAPAGWAPWPEVPARVATVLGVGLIAAGGGLLLAGLVRLGPALTPLPCPKRDLALVETGPYALVRHPMYGGGVVLAFGWALFVHGWLTLGYAVVLFVYLDVKSRREERWLEACYPGYAAYRRRVRKLLPFVY